MADMTDKQGDTHKLKVGNPADPKEAALEKQQKEESQKKQEEEKRQLIQTQPKNTKQAKSYTGYTGIALLFIFAIATAVFPPLAFLQAVGVIAAGVGTLGLASPYIEKVGGMLGKALGGVAAISTFATVGIGTVALAVGTALEFSARGIAKLSAVPFGQSEKVSIEPRLLNTLKEVKIFEWTMQAYLSITNPEVSTKEQIQNKNTEPPQKISNAEKQKQKTVNQGKTPVNGKSTSPTPDSNTAMKEKAELKKIDQNNKLAKVQDQAKKIAKNSQFKDSTQSQTGNLTPPPPTNNQKQKTGSSQGRG